MPKFCYYNGKIIPIAKAALPINDIGILRGYAIFDYAKVYNGKPFLLKEHIARFEQSAKKMGLIIPAAAPKIEKIIKELLTKNKIKDQNAGIRMILTGGTLVEGLSFNPAKPSFFILIEDLKDLPENLFEKGAALITHEHERMFSDIKTTNYITAVQLQKEKNKKKAVEILYLYNSKVLECSTSNFFIVKKNKIYTPAENILIGITRNHVIKLARNAGMSVVEKNISKREMLDADEAFITASNKEVLPIVHIDDALIGNGQVGEVSKKLRQLFIESISNK
ncbi:MAG: aminotransferase class IV [Patescibacteria group bacterium]